MKRLIALLLLVAPALFAQSAAITLQVTDVTSQSWNNGSYQAILTPPPGAGPVTFLLAGVPMTPSQITITGSLNGTGSATFNLSQNYAITPPNTTWTLNVCPQATSSCYKSQISASGATQNVTLTPPAIVVTLAQPPYTGTAYSDSEVTGVVVGSNYFNLTSQQQRICTVVSGSNCSTWVVSGGGGGSGDLSNPVAANAIQYVAPGGSDSNTGLSWALAMADIYTAICSLPGGNCSTQVAGQGTVYVASGSSAGPFGTCGIWLMGPLDPNYASPPACWLKYANGNALTIEGIPNFDGGPNAHQGRAEVFGGSGVDNFHPGFQFDGASGPLWIKNIHFASVTGRAIVVGECSNHVRTGTCTTTNVTFDNPGGCANVSGSSFGPGMDITGFTFWVWIRNGSICGNQALAGTANNGSAILIDGTGNNGNGLIYISDMNLANGGIKFVPGADGGSVHVTNTSDESTNTPLLWFTAWPAGTDGSIENSISADGSGPLVESDGPSGPIVIDSSGVKGPATLIGSAPYSTTISPLRAGEYGLTSGYLIGETDAARRLSALVPVRFANLAYSNPSGWTTSVGTVSITTGVADPFGGTGAATLTSAAGGQVNLSPVTSESGVAGDWWVYGAWVQGGGWAPSAQTYLQNVCPTHGGFLYSANYANGGLQIGDGQWQYVWVAGKISTGAGSACISAVVQAGNPVTIYGPTAYYITNGTLSDNEVLEFVSNMSPVDSFAPVGSITNVSGHPLNVDSAAVRGSFGSNVTYSSAACETNFGATTLSGASTTTGQTCLPANAIIDAVVYRITTTITTAVSFTIGDSGSATRYCGTQSTMSAGTTGTCTAAGYYLNTSALGVKITPNTSPGAGAIRLMVYYHTWTAPTS
jgi:hypothetical protein